MPDCLVAELEHTPVHELAKCVTLACLWEATAPKPGNVHRGADFADTTFADYATSAAVVGPLVARAAELGVGRAVLEAVRATQQAVGKNTNLGTVLLLTPLAAVPSDRSLESDISRVVNDLTDDDTGFIYQAIRESQAGGLGQVPHADVWDDPPKMPLVEVMQLAAQHDLVARQYADGFREVFEGAVVWLLEGLELGYCLSDTIVHTQLRLMAAYPDSLIERKCGPDVAREASDRAAALLSFGGPRGEAYDRGLADFDFWLRSDGHRRNPGTTADLIAAGLFVILRESRVDWPVSFHRRGVGE